jgi:cobalt-zinc-cadmium efflux system outer membrane protein
LRTQIHRSILLITLPTLILSFLHPEIAQAETLAVKEMSTLTEREAVVGALSRPAWMEAETGRIAVAESVVTETGMMPNPVFAVSRDRLGMVGGDITERSVQISQTFDISGRRSLRVDAASQRLNSEKLDGRVRRLNSIAEVRRVFAETLHRNQIQSALGLWLTRIENASRVTAQLARAGEVSGYDRRRIEREAQTTRARLSVAQADAARSREALAALTGKKPDEVMHLFGNLLPDATPALDVLQARLRQRPDLESLLAQTEAFEREYQAAQRGWVPDLTVAIGQKTLEEPTRRGSGAIVGVSFTIPLFDRNQATQQRSFAKAQIVRAEHVLALSKADIELRSAWRLADELRNAVLAYRHEVSSDSQNLSGIAEAAYRSGEASLLELLDAYRTELDFSITELDLALRARLAQIDLETLSGVSSYE